MIRTGLEIVNLIAKGKAPKKVKQNKIIYEFDKEVNTYKREGSYLGINLLSRLNSEFEIIEVAEPEKQEIYDKLKSFAKKHNTEPIDWGNQEQEKWYIFYDTTLKCFGIDYRWDIKIFGQIYFTSKEITIGAIKEIGEDNIMKLFTD